jgi:NodT family efflux transporter outer membrane factor (OMF) lipoprotein
MKYGIGAGYASALLLASCTVGPNYEQPKVEVPMAFANAEPGAAGQNAPEADLAEWWRQFDDPILDRLITGALTANLDIMTAASRIEEAREQEIIQGAAGLPSLSAMGAAVRVHSNSNPFAQLFGGAGAASSGTGSGAGGASGSSGGAPASRPSSGATNLKLYSIGFDATWEIDFFGGVTRSVQAATAKEEAAIWALRDAEVTLTAEIARDYFSLREAQARIAIINAELERQRNTLEVINAKAATGFVTYLDVNQQTAQAAETAAQVPQLEAQVRANIDAIGVLLGRTPESVVTELAGSGAIPAAPAALPAGLPSDLLRRRPDIRQAERNLAAATAQVGVAVAQLYPKFDILGFASFAGTSLNSLLSTRNFGEAALANITWPIFSAGRLQANVRVNETEENQAYFAYKTSVLKALRDTDDALARYAADQQRLELLRQEIAAANSSVTIAQQQYTVGLTDYLNVLTAQSSLLRAQDEAAQTQAALATDLVSLYKALGGGWTDALPDVTGPVTAANPS